MFHSNRASVRRAGSRAAMALAALVVLLDVAGASSASMRVRANRITTLDDLFGGPVTARDVPLVGPPVPGASKSGALAGGGFAAKLAAAQTARMPGATALLGSEAASVVAGFRAIEQRGIAQRATQRAALDALRAGAPDLETAFDRGRLVYLAASDLGATPEEFLHRAAPLLGLVDPARELRLLESERDALGMTHHRYQQVHRGLDIWAHDAIVHEDAAGRIVAYGGRLVPTPVAIDPEQVRIDASTAQRAAAAAVGFDTRRAPAAVTTNVPPVLEIYAADQAAPVLVWRTRAATALDAVWDVFVDAVSGDVVHRTSRVASDGPVAGSGLDLVGQNRALSLFQVGANFFNINTTKPMYDSGASDPPQNVVGGIRIFDAQHGEGDPLAFSASTNANNWSGKAAHVSAAFNAGIVFDYFSQRHSRNSIDGDGGTIEVVVNFKNNFNNAFWNGQFMVFGNGDGNTFSDLAAALDVTAHEMAHGVVENTANLVYETQSGALNESFADVFGASAEWFARPSAANWLLGEEITTPNIANDALRNMQDPGASNVAFNGQQPTHMSEYENLPNTPQGDNGGVHVNSGIPNRAFYLFATNAALGATNAERIGKAERVYYRALANYLTRRAQFVDCRLAVIRAAEDLYGAGGPVAQAAASAFNTVGIAGGDPSDPPPTLPPVEGSEYIGALNASNNVLVRATLDFNQIIPLSTVGVSNKPSFSDDGELVVFVDSGQRLRYALTDGSGEDFLSQQPIWRSIALSPDRTRLAATSTALDDSIYILDLTGGGDDHVFAIQTPNYGGEGDDAAQFADFLDYSNDGRYVLYDCLNRRSTGSGTLEYWEINVLRVQDGAVQRVFPPQPPGVSVGNPSFSPLADHIIVFDFAAANGNVSVVGADLQEGNVGVVTNNFGSPGRPSFSTNAQQVVYQYVDQQGAQLWVVSLEDDGITGSGDDVLRANGGYDPTWFAVGARPAVTLAGLAVHEDGDAALLAWEATVDAAHDHFVVLRDVGFGWEPRSGPIHAPAAPGRDRFEYRDALADLPRGTTSVRYAVQAVERDGTATLAGTIELVLGGRERAGGLVLLPNVPNPFNPTTAIRFSIGRRQPVRLDVYDTAGRRVRALWSGVADPGTHARLWDGRDDAGKGVASGSYLVRLESAGAVRSRKLSLLR